ncbi:MAG: hypothetical protein K8I30_22730, partial [Anaerolineae bacterium]|nr:hypothetical protein [Anaerolineae bacterium]
QEYQLRTAKDDGTARHGDVRGRAWNVDEADATHISMTIRSADFPDMNWPFQFSASADYALDDGFFEWTLVLKNEDSRPFPAGFGHHPYFVRPADSPPQVQIRCHQQFDLVDFMAVSAPVPIKPELSFRRLRALDNRELNDLLTNWYNDDAPIRIEFPGSGVSLTMEPDELFKHILIYAPGGKPFFAVEPMTNASDGFNLFADNIPSSGVFVLQPGEEKSGSVLLNFDSEN